MDTEIKKELEAINSKLATYIEHQEEICELHRKPLEEHAKDGLHFRDKLVKFGESLKINWTLTLLMVGGAIGGFFWMLRSIAK